jgi:hypothetical protein
MTQTSKVGWFYWHSDVKNPESFLALQLDHMSLHLSLKFRGKAECHF